MRWARPLLLLFLAVVTLGGCKPPPHFAVVRECDRVRLTLYHLRGGKLDRAFKAFEHRRDGLPVFQKLFASRLRANKACPAAGRVDYYHGKKKLLAVELSLAKGCERARYLVKKEQHVWKLSEDSLRYLRFLTRHHLPTTSPQSAPSAR